MRKVSVFVAGLLLGSSMLIASEGGAHWGYGQESGPAHWGDLKPEYSMCKDGKNQSPINITSAVESELKDLSLEYPNTATEVINNGHTVQVNFPAGNVLKIDGKEFELKQFHFHTPSENQIDGKNFPMEAHLVHANKDGALAVIAVMIDEGKSNATLDKIINNMPKKAGDKNSLKDSKLNALDLLPKEKDYYRFSGSLTTPPCSEGVRWFVLKEPIKASKEQLVSFTNVLGKNNRPVQPLNARKVLEID